MADRGAYREALQDVRRLGVRALLPGGNAGEAPSRRHLARLRKWLLAYAVLVVLAGWIYAAVYVVSDRQQSIARATNDLLSIDAALNVHTEAVLNDGLGAAQAAANHLPSLTRLSRPPIAQELDVLRKEQTGGQYVAALFIGNSQGILLSGRDGYEYAGAPVPAWLREAFVNSPELFVGLPLTHPRDPQRRVIPIARKIAGSGERAVYAGAWFGIDALHRRYVRLLPRDGVMGLVSSKGGVLAAITAGTSAQVAFPSAGGVIEPHELDLLRTAPTIVSGRSASGREMLYAIWQPVPGADLYTVVGRSIESILEPWRTRMWTVLSVVSVATFLLLVMTALLYHYVDQLNLAKSALERSNETLEQRVAERTLELEQANARLAAANEELEAFSAAASHDLRSPLTTISGQAGLLAMKLDEVAGPEARERLERIQAGVRRAVEVIDGMLSLARISRHDLKREDVDLGALVRQAVEEMREHDRDRALELRIQEPVYVKADARLMKSLISNLVSNAWKYSASKERVEIEFSCQQGPGGPVYCLADRGAGFDMTHAAQLFHPFRRLHSMKEFPGTGVGLAIVARIVSRYGGRVWAEGEVGRGATFCFTLPLAQPGMSAAAASAGPQSSSPSSVQAS